MKIEGIILRTPDVARLTEFWGTRVGFEVTRALGEYSFLDGGDVTLTIAAVDGPIDDDSWTEIVACCQWCQCTTLASSRCSILVAVPRDGMVVR